MRRGDPDLKKVVDDSIKSLFVSDEINAIYGKWFTQPIPPKGLNLKFPDERRAQNNHRPTQRPTGAGKGSLRAVASLSAKTVIE